MPKENLSTERKTSPPQAASLDSQKKSLWYYGRERFTVIIASDMGKRSLRFQMSFFSLLFIGLLFFVLLVGFFWFSLDSSGQKIRLSSRSHDIADTEASLDVVRDEVGELITSTELFRDTLSSTMDILGMESISEVSTSSGYGELSSLFSVENGRVIAEVSELQSLRKTLDRSVPMLDKIERVYSGQQDVLADIPSIWPLQDVYGRVTMIFGTVPNPFHGRWYIHRGVDIGFGFGVPIVATANGTVVKKEYAPNNYGYYIDIQHKYGFKTRYAHMQRHMVDIGQKVSQGEVIGTMGDTGHVTGVHLHYEVMLENRLMDPTLFLNIRNDSSEYLVPSLRRKLMKQ